MGSYRSCLKTGRRQSSVMERCTSNLFRETFLVATQTSKILRFLDELNTRGVLWGLILALRYSETIQSNITNRKCSGRHVLRPRMALIFVDLYGALGPIMTSLAVSLALVPYVLCWCFIVRRLGLFKATSDSGGVSTKVSRSTIWRDHSRDTSSGNLERAFAPPIRSKFFSRGFVPLVRGGGGQSAFMHTINLVWSLTWQPLFPPFVHRRSYLVALRSALLELSLQHGSQTRSSCLDRLWHDM